jgi:aprataxin
MDTLIIGGQVLQKSQSCFLKDGDKIELLEGLYEHKVVILESMSMASPEVKTYPNHWSQALFASMEDPELLEYEDDKISIIKDKYPKAKMHFLVLPRDNLATLFDLQGPAHADLVKYMMCKAKETILDKHAQDKFKMGFHAIPSMAQVHMHVISQDFVSPCLKNKKHWNSFNTEYFIPAEQVLEDLETNGSIRDRNDKKELLKQDLKCNHCSYIPKHLPDLKNHLLKHVAE